MQIDKDDIHIAVVITRIRHSIRTVIVEQPQINVPVSQSKNFTIETPVTAQSPQRLRQIGIRPL